MPLFNGVDISHADLNQRYQNTFIKIRRWRQDKVVQVHSFTDGRIYLADGNDFLIQDLNLVVDFPEMGVTQIEKDTHVFTVNPVRQWKRGLSLNRIKDFCRNSDKRLSNFRGGISLKVAEGMFNKVYKHPNEALELIKSGEFNSCAIDKNYWYSGNKNHVYLWRNKACIGERIQDSLFLFPGARLLSEEVKTDFKELYVA